MTAPEGMTTLTSRYGPGETMDRLVAAVTARGMTVFARIDHGAGAASAGLPLHPMELLVFGSAQAGTPLMQRSQTVGIDLPLKALVWQGADGATRLGYNDPHWIAGRHGLGDDSAQELHAMTAALAAVARQATASVPGAP